MSVKNIWHTGDSDGEYVFFKHRMSGKLPCLKPLRAALNIGTHRGPIAFSTNELDDNLGFLFQKHPIGYVIIIQPCRICCAMIIQ